LTDGKGRESKLTEASYFIKFAKPLDERVRS
jgi:hypothetical protein